MNAAHESGAVQVSEEVATCPKAFAAVTYGMSPFVRLVLVESPPQVIVPLVVKVPPRMGNVVATEVTVPVLPATQFAPDSYSSTPPEVAHIEPLPAPAVSPVKNTDEVAVNSELLA